MLLIAIGMANLTSAIIYFYLMEDICKQIVILTTYLEI